MHQNDTHLDDQSPKLSSFRLLSSRRKQLQAIKVPFNNNTHLI